MVLLDTVPLRIHVTSWLSAVPLEVVQERVMVVDVLESTVTVGLPGGGTEEENMPQSDILY